MVIVRLQGGLGNQMFQYALGRVIALNHGVTLKLDLSNFDEFPDRNYELANFGIQASLANAADMQRAKGYGLLGRYVVPILGSTFKSFQFRTVWETSPRFNPEVLAMRGNLYLLGHWQSAQYFQSIESIIRDDFTLNAASDPINADMEKRIRGVASVSMHVRRGDYISDARASELLGTLSLEYYQAATRVIADRVHNPHFFIFTDDSAWAKEHIRLNHPVTFVAHNGFTKSYFDMHLMRSCDHHVVANSTFSWWGAWLNRNPAKIVVAPRQWYQDPSYDATDLVPKEWERV